MSIKLTDRAIEEVKKVMEEQDFTPEEYVLEAGIRGGGCSGWEWTLSFSERSEVKEDKCTFFNFDGVNVAVKNVALLYMEGTTIDFHDGLMKRGFIFENNAVRSTCGCGKSVQF